MTQAELLRQTILARLSKIIDPETGADVVQMQLLEDLTVDEKSWVTYRFRPSSPVCPLAVTLALDIQSAVGDVAGVLGQDMEVVGFVQAETLTALLKQERDMPQVL
jgi:metal-sulfur cluster biosynthetic enzyme